MSGGGFQHDIAGGQGALIIPSLHSPNYAPGSAGWTVNKDGSVEFNNGTFRGHIVDGGMFVYTGTPAAGNPPIAWMATGTTDPYGNTLPSTSGVRGVGTFAADSPSGARVTLQNGQLLIRDFSGNQWTVQAEALSGTPYLNLSVGSQSVYLNQGGYWQTSDPAVPGQPETWHPMSLLNSWAAAARITPKYRLLASPAPTTEIIGSLTAPAGVVAGQIIWNLPAGYTVSGLQSVVARNVTTNAAVMLSVVTGSPQTLQYQSGAAAGDIIDFHAFLSQDA